MFRNWINKLLQIYTFCNKQSYALFTYLNYLERNWLQFLKFWFSDQEILLFLCMIFIISNSELAFLKRIFKSPNRLLCLSLLFEDILSNTLCHFAISFLNWLPERRNIVSGKQTINNVTVFTFALTVADFSVCLKNCVSK